MRKRKHTKTTNSPYAKLFGVSNLGRGRPESKGVLLNKVLPNVPGVSSELRRKASDRAMKVLKYTHWKEFAEVYEAEALFMVSELEKEKEDG